MKNGIETNLKLVKGGNRISLNAKRVKVKGPSLDITDLEKVCNFLMYYNGISATPLSVATGHIVVEANASIPDGTSFKLDKGKLKLEVELETSERVFSLSFTNLEDRKPLAQLYKRALLISIKKSNMYWTFDSPRIFYEKVPFKVGGTEWVNGKPIDHKDISAYRRYDVSEMILEDGIAISVDVKTAFFTNKTVDHYHKNGLSRRFRQLTNRQGEQKGTMLYQDPTGNFSKCYFIKYEKDISCSQTGKTEIKGKDYQSLYDYCKQRNAKYDIRPDDRIAMVSFYGLASAVPVVANKLKFRVMNDMLSSDLSQVDKIGASERRPMIEKFWANLGHTPFGKNYRGLDFQGDFYMPNGRTGYLDMPDLVFADNVTLRKPRFKDKREYKNNFNSRKKYLNKNGCYFSPLTMTRDIHFVYPEGLAKDTMEAYANDVCELISRLTGVNVEPIFEKYSNYKDALENLRNQFASMVVFAFDKHDPTAYFTIGHELKSSNIKRLTTSELKKHYSKRKQKHNRWLSYIELNSFDILQQLGCVLWTYPVGTNYDMHLAIDVGDKFNYFCFSFFLFKVGMSKPIIKTVVYPKTSKKEAINPIILQNKIKVLFSEWEVDLLKYSPQSLLIIRDGKECTGEYQAIVNAMEELKEKKCLPENFDFDVVEYHKTTQKNIRFWSKQGEIVDNTLEGSYVQMDANHIFVNTTGVATLRQGTAAPILIKSKKQMDIMKAAQDIFTLSQLNFSSPTVAQRFCLPIKQADEQLNERKNQEIERIK